MIGDTFNSSVVPYSPSIQPPPQVFSFPLVPVQTRAALDQLPPTFGSKSKAFLLLLGSPSLQTVATFLQQDGVVTNLLDTYIPCR